MVSHRSLTKKKNQKHNNKTKHISRVYKFLHVSDLFHHSGLFLLSFIIYFRSEIFPISLLAAMESNFFCQWLFPLPFLPHPAAPRPQSAAAARCRPPARRHAARCRPPPPPLRRRRRPPRCLPRPRSCAARPLLLPRVTGVR